MALGLKSGHGSRQPLKLRPVGNSLLIHPKGEPDRRALLMAERLVPDPKHHVVVVDLPPGSLEHEWETVAKLLADRTGGVRLVYGRRGREDVPAIGQRLADRLGQPVLAPDGEALPTPGGQLFIPGEHGAGWLCFRPGRTVQRDSRRFPKTRWEFSTPDRPLEISPHGVAEPLPSGVWVRSTADRRLNTHRQRLMQVLPTHPDILIVVIGSPGAPEVPLEDVTRFWDSLLPTVRPLVRFVHYGSVALPDDRGLGQTLADVLEQQVVLYGGVPVQATVGFEPPEIRVVRADGWLSGLPFVCEMAYLPTAEGKQPAPPALYGLRAPLAGLKELSYGVYQYAPDAVLETVQSGLWLRPAEEPAGGDGVRCIPAEPEGRLLLFDRSSAESTERMRSLAEDVLWLLDPEIRTSYRVAPADDVASVRAAQREAATSVPVDMESWSAAAAAAPVTHTPTVAPGTTHRAAADRVGTAAASSESRPGQTGADAPVPTAVAAPTGAAPADADDRDTREDGPVDSLAGPGPVSPAVLPPEVRALMESGPVEPGPAGSVPAADAEGGPVREVDAPPSVVGGEAGAAAAGDTGQADEDAPRGGLRRLFRRRPEASEAGTGASVPTEPEPESEPEPAGSGPALDAEGGTVPEAGAPLPPPRTGVNGETDLGEPRPRDGVAPPEEPRAEGGEAGAPAAGAAGNPGEAGPGGGPGLAGPDEAKAPPVQPTAGPEPAPDAGGHGTQAADSDGVPDGQPDEAGTTGADDTAAPVPAPSTSTTAAHAAEVDDGAPRQVRGAAPRIRLESGAPDEPWSTPGGTDVPAAKPPVSDATLSGPAGPDTPEQAAPPASEEAPAAAPAAPPAAEQGQQPPAAPAAARTPAVKVQPVPKAAACAVPPQRGLEEERAWVRRNLSSQYNAVQSTVSGVMAESPGLRGAAGADASDALIELVAVRLYLFGDTRSLDAAVRSATIGPHVPLARCVASGLRRLPSYRGPALLHARLGDAERAWYREGRLATEWAFCSARTNPSTGPAGSTDFLIWSLTGRRTNLIDPGVPDRVMFLPGTSFKVLRVHTGERHCILLRELPASEIAEDGSVATGTTPLDEIAVSGLEKTLEALTEADTRKTAKAPVGPLGAPPGLVLPSGGPKPRTTAGRPQRRKAAKK